MEIKVYNCINELIFTWNKASSIFVKEGFLEVKGLRGSVGVYNLEDFSFEVEDDEKD